MLVCARRGCDVEFDRNAHNQKYHDDECLRLATNERMMEKYYQRRDQRNGKIRTCVMCEVTKLSRYNNTQVCSSCDLKKEVQLNRSVLSMLSSISWQS